MRSEQVYWVFTVSVDQMDNFHPIYMTPFDGFVQRIGCLRMRRRRALCSNFRRGARRADVELEG